MLKVQILVVVLAVLMGAPVEAKVVHQTTVNTNLPMLQNNYVCNADAVATIDLKCGLVAYYRFQETLWDGSNGEVRDISGSSDAPTENQIEDSELIVANWTMFGTTTGSSDSFDIGPDGQSNLANIVDADAVNHAQFSITWAAANDETYTISAHFKKTASASTFPGIRLQYINGVSINSTYAINTDTGVVTKRDTATVADNVKVQNVGDFWRVSITFSNDASDNDTGRIILYGAINTDASDTWVASTQGSAKMGYAQVSKTSFPVDYIQTSGAAIEQLYNHGQAVNGATTIAGGKLGRAGDFEIGTLEYVSVPTPDEALELQGGGTFAAWIFPRTDGGTNVGRIISSPNAGWAVFTDANGRVLVSIGGVNRFSSASAVTYNDVFYFVTVTIESTGVTIYSNGVDVTENAGDGTLPADESGELRIGAITGVTDRNFDGIIDEVAIWDGALSADEIKHYYNGSRGRYIK